MSQWIKTVIRFPRGIFTVLNASIRGTPLNEGADLKDVIFAYLTDESDGICLFGLAADHILRAGGEAALVRVTQDNAGLMLCYRQGADNTQGIPSLIVRRISKFGDASDLRQSPQLADGQNLRPTFVSIYSKGAYVNGTFNEWLINTESSAGIEGLCVKSPLGLPVEGIRYRVILGPNWESPWTRTGEYCGSKDIGFPICGIRIKLSDHAKSLYRLTYSGLFHDGEIVGPVDDGDACVSSESRMLVGLCVILEKLQSP